MFTPLPESEKQKIEWNNTQTNFPQDKCVHQLFEAQVECTPDAVAVVFDESRLTYTELNQRANQLAHYLKKLGVGAEVLVGIYIPRSLEMIIGLLGILKAGGAYVPVAPVYPPKRVAFMLEDAQTAVLLTQENLASQLSEQKARVICLDTDWEMISQESEENLSTEVRADNLAYVTYTSGSTGTPKGVCIVHRGIVRLVKNTNDVNLTGEEIFLQLAPISFEASTFEIWGCLLKRNN